MGSHGGRPSGLSREHPFPTPSGPYGVGTITYHWVDTGREALLPDRPGACRELMVQVWYPAHPPPSAPRAPYLPDAAAVAPVLAEFLREPRAKLTLPLAALRTNAVERAPVAGDEPSYPVVVVLVGIKGSYRQIHTFQVEELASHGFVVAAVDQPSLVAMVVFPDGRRVAYDDRWAPPRSEFMDAHVPDLARDVPFTLDQLGEVAAHDPHGVLDGRLDLGRVGLIGHSMGAIVGGEACRMEPRVRAALLEEGRMPEDVVRDGLAQPILFLSRPASSMRLERAVAGGWPESDIDETLGTMRAVYERLPGRGWFLEIPGAFHLDMTDAPMLSELVAWPGLTGPLGAARAHEIINAYTVALFARELRGDPAPLLDGLSPRFPEVLFESRRD